MTFPRATNAVDRQGAAVAIPDEGAFLDLRPLVTPIAATRAPIAGRECAQRCFRPAFPIIETHL